MRSHWQDIYETILGDSRFSSQALDYMNQIRERYLLNEDERRHNRNFPFLFVKKEEKELSLYERKKQLALILQK